MVRDVVKTGELFATFKFDGKDCSDMGVYSITSGATYSINIEPVFSDQTLEAPAYDGKYYYGTQITGQQFIFNCFCHDLLTTEYDRLRDWLSPRRVGKLILSDQPYKYYLVKVVAIDNLSAYPLNTIQTPAYTYLGDFGQGDVVYTGTFSVTFETVGSAYGYGLCYYRDDLIYDAALKYGRDYYYNSGLLYKDMSLKTHWTVEGIDNQYQKIPFYNPGSAEGFPIYTIEGEGSVGGTISFRNNSAGTYTIIDLTGMVKPITIDMSSQSITDGTGTIFYGRFTGNIMRLRPYDLVYELPETFVKEIEYKPVQFDSFYIEDNLVSINPDALKVNQDMIGMYFCTENNGGSEILSVDIENNTLTLDPNVDTIDILPASEDRERAGVAYNYIPNAHSLPDTANEGDVCDIDGVWYSYHNGKWSETNYFQSDEEFKNIYGDYITIYRMFGATIVSVDDLRIATNIGGFDLSAELRPRYL